MSCFEFLWLTCKQSATFLQLIFSHPSTHDLDLGLSWQNEEDLGKRGDLILRYATRIIESWIPPGHEWACLPMCSLFQAQLLLLGKSRLERGRIPSIGKDDGDVIAKLLVSEFFSRFGWLREKGFADRLCIIYLTWLLRQSQLLPKRTSYLEDFFLVRKFTDSLLFKNVVRNFSAQ